MAQLKSNGVMHNLRSSGVSIYDNSMLATFITCPRMFDYRHNQGLVAKNREPAVALEFGLSVHRALELWQKTSKDDDKAINEFVQGFAPFEEQPKISPKTGKELGATYTVLYGCSVLTEYFRRYRNDEREVVELESPLAEEVADGVFIAGKVDKIVSSPKSLVFADYKTTKYMNQFLLNPNPQFMTYKFLSEKLTGKPVSGELDIIGVSKSKSLDELLRREPFDYTSHQMSEWRKSLLGLVSMIEKAKQENFWPQTWRCQPFFRDCDFMPLCTMPNAEGHDRLVESVYKVEYWDPFKETD